MKPLAFEIGLQIKEKREFIKKATKIENKYGVISLHKAMAIKEIHALQIKLDKI